jgi:hypothetical protein
MISKQQIMHVNHVIQSLGWDWVAGLYESASSVLTLVCKACGSEVRMPFRNKSKLVKCAKCFTKVKSNQHPEVVNKAAVFLPTKMADLGYEFVSQSGSKLHLRCMQCSNEKTVSLRSIIKSPGCKVCHTSKLIEKQKNLLQEKLPSHAVLDYKNSYTSMQLRCPQEHEFTIHPAVVARSKKTRVFCPVCIRNAKKVKKHQTFETELSKFGWGRISGCYETPHPCQLVKGSKRFSVSSVEQGCLQIFDAGKKRWVLP